MRPAAIKLVHQRYWAGLICLLAGFCAPAATNTPWFTRVWQTDDGLVNNNIHAIAQGQDGYLWVVTPASLMRFDGVSFSRFPIKDSTSPIEPHIRTILCSRTGLLWIVRDNGTVIGLNPDFSVAMLLKTSGPPDFPLARAEAGDGSLWLGYPDAIYRLKDGKVTRFGTKEDGALAGNVQSLTSDGVGRIWLAQGNQICVFQNGRFQPIASEAGVQCLAATHTNAVWLVAGAHLFRCDGAGALRDYGVFQNASAAPADALLEDHAGSVWIGTDGNGLFRYDSSAFERVETSHSSILSLAEDREGNIWVGTGGGGLDRVSLSRVRQEVLEYNRTLEQIQSLCEDTQGGLWGATHNGALVSRAGSRWEPVLTNAPFAGTVMCVAADPQGGIWIGTRNGKLLRLVNSTNYITWPQTRGADNAAICGLLPAASGDLWILGTQRVQRLHDGQLQEVTLPRSVGRITAITEDVAGNIWIGAKGMVLRFDGTNFVDESRRLLIPDRNICCLYATPDGSVWISCGGLGLLRYQDGRVGEVGVEQGLFNDYISQMAADGRGWLWFGSDLGIFKVRQRELAQAMEDHSLRLRPIVYGRNEGLPSLEAVFSTAAPYVLPRALRTRDGRVWLLMHTGLAVADPEVLPEQYAAPPVLLTRVAMDGQTLAAYGTEAPSPREIQRDSDGSFARGVISRGEPSVANLKTLNVPLRLPPGHRHLEFDFTAIHLSAPENVRFRYQLAGFDNDWIDAGDRRSADYSRLTSGHYQFRVAACVGDGPWNETPAELALTVAPFFWATWWFRLGMLVLFTAGVIAIVRYISFRRLQLKMRLLAQRAALDRERTRIARDLHDDLGCNLNQVALTLDMMQRGPAALESDNGKLQQCSTLVRGTAQSVDEIVWAINPRNDTLRYMVDYISQFAVEFLQAADIACLMDLPDRIPESTVSPEARHNLLLVVKEALNNTVRHAQASEVRVRITTAENEVAIIIEDNGRGFERPPDNATCDGLRNMRQRMEEIGGQFQLDSRPGAGARVAFRYSWPAKTL